MQVSSDVSTCIYSGGVVNAEDIVWTSLSFWSCLFHPRLKCALVRQKWAAGWGSSVRWKTTVRERFTPPSRDRRWRPRSGWPTRTTTWTSWWGKTVRCQSFSYLWWIHSDIKWLLKETISRVRNVEVRIICEELLKGEIKPWHTEILQQRSLILCCSANPRSDDTCKWQTPNPPRILSVNHSCLEILQHTLTTDCTWLSGSRRVPVSRLSGARRGVCDLWGGCRWDVGARGLWGG